MRFFKMHDLANDITWDIMEELVLYNLKLKHHSFF